MELLLLCICVNFNCLQVLLASVKSSEDRSKSVKEDVEMSDEDEDIGEDVTTQDEIGQRILTALKKVKTE